jgi:CheY-like chemotaxis protein
MAGEKTGEAAGPLSVVIVDDHPVVRAGMRAALDDAGEIAVVAEGSSGGDALRLVAQHRPKWQAGGCHAHRGSAVRHPPRVGAGLAPDGRG